MKDLFTSSMPFSMIGIAFIGLGLVLEDASQVNFGIVWLVIALGAVLWRKTQKERTNGL